MASDDYLPVPWDFRELLDEALNARRSGKIHYFAPEPQIALAQGQISEIIKENNAEYLLTDKGDKVRLDKIITLYGRPGPAFDDYEAYGNACMACRDDDD